MKHLLVSVALIALALTAASFVRAEYPKPSPYPKSWELKFDHAMPKRIVVAIPGISVPQAFWYMTYTVTNDSGKEQMFLPNFEMLLKTGRVVRSDVSIPAKVFDQIKTREKKQFLEPYPKIAGELRLGEDQARDGVAIWLEPMSQMGTFSVFVGGLSGEAVILNDDKGEPIKTADGKPTILRKTLQLNFQIRGDDIYPGEDLVSEISKEWVMR